MVLHQMILQVLLHSILSITAIHSTHILRALLVLGIPNNPGLQIPTNTLKQVLLQRRLAGELCITFLAPIPQMLMLILFVEGQSIGLNKRSLAQITLIRPDIPVDSQVSLKVTGKVELFLATIDFTPILFYLAVDR
jgi:hypothetical protein